MAQNYSAIWFAIDEPENKIEFFRCSDDKMDEEVLAKLKFGPLDCKPRFLLFRNGEIKAEISGADFTSLEEAIYKHLPREEAE